MKSKYGCFVGVLGTSDSLAALSSKKMATALGQLIMATAVNKTGIPARVYNLDVTDWQTAKKDILKFVPSHERTLVAFTLVAGNVDVSLRLTRWFKDEIDAAVIVGGPEITTQTADYYASMECIDGVIVGNAANCISELAVNGLAQKKIRHLSPQINFGSIEVDYRLLFGLSNDHGGVSYIWGGDCHLHSKRCYFCARQSRGFGFRDPHTVWKELLTPYHSGLNYFYNTADSVAVFPEKFKKFVRARPSELENTVHKVFINATQVTENLAEYLSRLNALAAVGIESLSNLSGASKGTTTDNDNMKAIRTLAKHKVKMLLTFVLGLPGETHNSLRQNTGRLLEVVEEYYKSIYMVTVSPLLITIGSRAFDEMEKSMKLPQSTGGAYYDPLLLSRLYLDRYCGVDRAAVVSNIRELYQLVKSKYPDLEFDSKGISKLEKNDIERQTDLH